MNFNFEGSLDGSLSFGAAANTARAHDAYELSAAFLPGVELRVLSFEGTEALSELFSFEIVFMSDLDPAALEAALIGRPVTFTMNIYGEARRVVQGIASSLQVEGVRQSEQRNQYRVRLVPKMWLLRRRKTSRIFQDVTLADVVDGVLGEWGVAHRWAVTRDFPVRAYCVQYQETDYDFVTRLLAEAGVFFYFEPPSALLEEAGGSFSASLGAAAGAIGAAVGGSVGGAITKAASETLVLCDDAGSYRAIASTAFQELVDDAMDAGASVLGALGAGPGSFITSLLRTPAPAVPFRDLAGMYAEDECISTLELRHTLRSQAVFLRDYDFERPPLQLTAKASSGIATTLAGAAKATASEGLDGGRLSLAATMSALAGSVRAASFDNRFEVYDHHGEYDETDVTTERAKTELEQHRADAVMAYGQSTCRRLAPGYRFLLEGHVIAELDREFAVVKISHQGVIPELAGDGGHVYANTFECVPSEVPFRPPCPKRNLQQVLETAVVVGPPGEEIHTDEYGRVKVQFYWDREGTYDDRSSCWLRVLTPWAGASWGFQFVPRVGMEVLVSFLGGDEDRPVVLGCVYNRTHPTPHVLPQSKTRSGIRSQSTPGGMGFNEIAFEDQAGDEELYVRAQKDMRELVQNDHLAVIGANDTTRVGGDQQLSVDGNQKVAVGGDQEILVRGGRRETVSGGVDHFIAKDLHVAIAGEARRVVSGNAHDEVTGDSTTRVAGDATTMVIGEKPRASLLYVDGTSRFASSEMTEITSEKEVVIRCGKSVLRIMPDAIELVAPEIRVRSPGSGIRFAEGAMEIHAKNSAGITSAGVTLKSAAAQIKLTDAASVEAAQIHLGTEAPTADTKNEASAKATKVELKDKKNQPLAHQHYVVLTKSGSRIGGMVGKDGADEIYLDQGDRVVFTEVGGAKRQ